MSTKNLGIASVLALALVVGCAHDEPKPAAKEAAKKESGKPLETAPATASEKTIKAVTAAVDAWASAWEKKNADAYIAAYAPDFKPEKGSRKEWAKQRRERLSNAKKIKVTIGNPQVTSTSPDKATAKFVQIYESDSYSDQTKKTLDFENVDGKWLITRERAG
jgi:murein L,D-transpeptidase YafK